MKRILLIEDDALHREWLKIALENADYEIFEASDGSEGLRLYREHPCDIVLTDMYMPEKDGIELILELKQRYPSVKIIAMSGGGLKGELDPSNRGAEVTLKAAKDFGADGILTKPITFKKLAAKLEEVLGSDLG